MSVYPFLTFIGNCEEAMRFYQFCFGGELQLTYLRESPHGFMLPGQMQDLIVQASLVSDHIRLFASDLGAEEGLYAGNSISLMISMSGVETLRPIFSRLSKKGEVTSPLPVKMKSGQWATLTDRYAIQWIFVVG